MGLSDRRQFGVPATGRRNSGEWTFEIVWYDGPEPDGKPYGLGSVHALLPVKPDDDFCIAALTATGGDVDAASDRIAAHYGGRSCYFEVLA